jgi:hypothetical protein
MEVIIILFPVIVIVWILWNVRKNNRASKTAALDEAWRIVLDDSNYVHRRRYEERKREDEARARKAEGL